MSERQRCLFKEEVRIASKVAVLSGLCMLLFAGCAAGEHRHGEQRSNPILTSDIRQPIPLSGSAGREHRAVMLQHLETVQVIMNALVEEIGRAHV